MKMVSTVFLITMSLLFVDGFFPYNDLTAISYHKLLIMFGSWYIGLLTGRSNV